MRRLPWVSFLLAFSICSLAQTRPTKSSYDEEKTPAVETLSPQLRDALVKLRDAALTNDYAMQQVEHLSNSIGPRPDGSPQAQAAVEYVAAELKKLGLDVHLEETKVPHWERGLETAELTDFPGRPKEVTQKIVLTALGGNTPTPVTGISAEVVVVDGFEQLKNLGRAQVAGKIVLFNVPFDKEKAAAGFWGEAYGEAVAYRSRGPKAAAELGAVAALVRSVGGADFRITHTGYSQPAGIPAGAVTSEDADLIAYLAEQGKVMMHMVLTSQNGPDVTSYNVVGDLKGAEHPEQIVIVSGHLDSWDLGTGAIDDAAGVAVAMETAKLVQQLKLHPKRTIRVVAWMDEENGGRGHDAYAALHAGDMANHIAAIESDLGAGHPLGFSAKVNKNAMAALEPVKEILRSFGANVFQQTEYSPGSDIAPLAKAGVPTLGILQDGRTYFNYHHTAADTPDKIVPRELRENAAAMAVMGYVLADMPEPLPR